MKEDLDQLLCEKYPKIFVNRNSDMRTTAMCWGFEHGDGWYNIINQLCNNIQHHIDWSHKSHESDLKWNEEHPENQREVRKICSQVVAEQVKEKFGTLRFYYQGGDDTVDGMVQMAEAMTEVTCEKCGSPATRRSGGWIRTLCDIHEEEYQNR
jgi:ribosomal protein S27E